MEGGGEGHPFLSASLLFRFLFEDPRSFDVMSDEAEKRAFYDSHFKLLHDRGSIREFGIITEKRPAPDCFLVECNFSVKLECPMGRVAATTCLPDFLAIESTFQRARSRERREYLTPS